MLHFLLQHHRDLSWFPWGRMRRLPVTGQSLGSGPVVGLEGLGATLPGSLPRGGRPLVDFGTPAAVPQETWASEVQFLEALHWASTSSALWGCWSGFRPSHGSHARTLTHSHATRGGRRPAAGGEVRVPDQACPPKPTEEPTGARCYFKWNASSGGSGRQGAVTRGFVTLRDVKREPLGLRQVALRGQPL